ncbi:MAG: VWA domain-containing protein [Candidatus Acidoferrales bacterium]
MGAGSGARAGLWLLSGLVGLSGAALGQQPPPPSAPGAVLRVDVDVVNVYCTVKDRKGRLMTDLETSDFEIREDGRKQEIRYFAQETDRPLTLALLVDTSGSQLRVLPAEKVAATQFLRQILRPSDLGLVMTFDVSVDLLQDFTSDVERLQFAINRAYINAPGNPVNPGPFPRSGKTGTRLYDAIYLATREKLAPEVGRKAIIVVTDGEDFGSRVDEAEAIEAAHRADVIIYAIGIADFRFYQRVLGRPYRGSGALEKLTRETGGRVIFPESAEKLLEAFDQIAAELRSQYSLGYSPTNRRRDGKFRKIEVRVKKKGLRVQARRGYYGPKP